MHAPWQRRLVHALVLPGVLLSAHLAVAQMVDSGRIEQLKRNLQTERIRVDAQPFDGSPVIRAELEALRDEVGYLLVAQRRGQPVTDAECHALEARLEEIRRRLRHVEAWPSGDREPSGTADEVPLGSELDVALVNPLSSLTARLDDRFEAVTTAPLRRDGRVLIAAGSLLSGVVTGVSRGWHDGQRGSLTVVFDQITVHGSIYAVDATVTQAAEGQITGELEQVQLRSRNTVTASEGRDVSLAAGSVLRVRFESPLALSTQ